MEGTDGSKLLTESPGGLVSPQSGDIFGPKPQATIRRNLANDCSLMPSNMADGVNFCVSGNEFEPCTVLESVPPLLHLLSNSAC